MHANYGSNTRAGASEYADETIQAQEAQLARQRQWQAENARMHKQRLADMEEVKRRHAREDEVRAYEALVERLRVRWRNSRAGSEDLFKARLPQLVRDEQARLMAQDAPDPLLVDFIKSGRYRF